MDAFTRIANGWKIAKSSLAVLKKNKRLLIFPVLSGISMLLILGSIVVSLFAVAKWDPANIHLGKYSRVADYVIMFLFYFVNYFVIVFFNMALTHCTRLYLKGEEVSVQAGIKFSFSRIGAILSWAIFAATVGTVLKAIQQNTGWVGQILSAIIGIIWAVSTFFVVPVIAYENLGPFKAFRRSQELLKQKWGESLSANFSLGLIELMAIIVLLIPSVLIGVFINPFAGIALGVMLFLIVVIIFSAAQVIFVSLIYQNVNGDIQEHFDQQLVDSLFAKKGLRDS